MCQGSDARTTVWRRRSSAPRYRSSAPSGVITGFKKVPPRFAPRKPRTSKRSLKSARSSTTKGAAIAKGLQFVISIRSRTTAPPAVSSTTRVRPTCMVSRRTSVPSGRIQASFIPSTRAKKPCSAVEASTTSGRPPRRAVRPDGNRVSRW